MSNDKPFFTAEEFHSAGMMTIAERVVWLNSKVAPLVESLSQGKQLHEADEKEIRRLVEENKKLRHELKPDVRTVCAYELGLKESEAEISQLKSLNATYREALEWYADGFKIMDHIDGTYTIHETWYAKAREALAKGKEEE